MKVNALSAGQKAQFQQLAMPKVKALIVEKFGADGEGMLSAFIGGRNSTCFYVFSHAKPPGSDYTESYGATRAK